MKFLAGDLGGTKTLLAVFSWDGALRKLHQQKYISAEWKCLEQMVQHFFANLPNGIDPPKSGCLAVAGPVVNGCCQITNLGWELNANKICDAVGLINLELVNDFCGLIYALPFLNADQQKEIQPLQGKRPSSGVIAIIGAGTGLGIARGLLTQNGVIALPSEGGHREFAPRSSIEWHLAKWLKSELQVKRLSIERIVSGNGLGHIAHWRLTQSDASGHPLYQIATTWKKKATKSPDLPELVSKAAKNGDPLMNEALEIWLGAYGSAVGDLALQELCTAGLWIGGGTAVKHLQGLRSKAFLEAMRNKGRFQSFIEALPVLAVVDQEAGLFGAACRARMITELNGKLN